MQKLIVYAVVVACASSLRIEDVEEGGCSRGGFQPVPDSDWSFVNNLIYISATSRHYAYGIVSGHPHFRQMRDNELRDSSCLTHNVTLPLGRGSAIGFGGRALGTYIFEPTGSQAGVFDLSYFPSNSGGAPLQQGVETITLTDYKTYAFFANCFIVNGSEQKSWKLITDSPNISASMRRRIEQHAVSLGFDRNNFLFLNYDNCRVDVGQNDRVLVRDGQRNWRNTGAQRVTGSIGRGNGFGQLGWHK